MKIKLLFALILLTITKLESMEEPTIDQKLSEVPELKNILTGAPQPEFLEAYKLATKKSSPSLKALTSRVIQKSEIPVSEGKIPAEVKEFANKIEFLSEQIETALNCPICSKADKELLLNLINNRNFTNLTTPLVKKKLLDKLLMNAARDGNINLLNLALSFGPDIDYIGENGYSPLMEAAYSGHENIVIKLLKAGANIYATSWNGYSETALDLAKLARKPKIVKILVDAFYRH